MTTSTRRKRYIVGFVSALAAAALVATAVHAGSEHHRRRADIFSKLDLSDSARSAIEDVFAQARPLGKELRTKQREERAALRELMAADAPDITAVRTQIANVGAAQTELHQHRAETRLRALAVLTPEQRQQLRDARKEMRERHAGRRHKRRAQPE